MVEIIKDEQFYKLTDLTSKADAHFAFERVDDIAYRIGGADIRNVFPDGRFCNIVPCLRKIVMNVALQHPSIGSVLVVVSVQMRLQPFQSVIRTFSFLAGNIVANEVLNNILIKATFAERTLKLPVNNARGHYRSLFWLVYLEHLILADLVALVAQSLLQYVSVPQAICFIAGHRILPAHISA